MNSVEIFDMKYWPTSINTNIHEFWNILSILFILTNFWNEPFLFKLKVYSTFQILIEWHLGAEGHNQNCKDAVARTGLNSGFFF